MATAISPDHRMILQCARVPEHSLPLMQAMSGGKPFQAGNYLFYHAQNWLMAIGYPLKGRFSQDSFADALAVAESRLNPEAIFAISPAPPAGHKQHIIENDRYYVLSASAAPPPRLRNPLKHAKQHLKITESTEFTPAHRKLWAEFLQGRRMNERVAELYARTPAALANGSLRLLNAWDANGNLSACLLLDYAPDCFLSYILGAHSRRHYVPHAADLLFAEMLAKASASGKRFVHLGLGVNEGVLRFKLKWGAKPSWPFIMAQWQRDARRQEESAGSLLAKAILNSPAYSARQFLQTESSQRPFAMLWRLEKNGRTSWLAGTAHFFLHSFETSFRSLFKQVDTVIFEGPLDATFMDQVEQAGRKPPPGASPLIDSLDENEIRQLERTVNGPGSLFARLLELERPGHTDVRWLLRRAKPWYAFFTLWTRFLERQGWRQSVDMEAWRIALEMNRNVIAMENLEEQLESLDSLPPQRAINFFRACGSWKKRAASNLRAYLAGDLERMMGSSAEFPTRTEHIVSRRDQRFRERMRPYLEAGGAAVFVGSAHIVNLRQMLSDDGFSVRQAPHGLWPRLNLGWRKLVRPDDQVQW